MFNILRESLVEFLQFFNKLKQVKKYTTAIRCSLCGNRTKKRPGLAGANPGLGGPHAYS